MKVERALETFAAVDAEIAAIEVVQTKKVIELARRLRPGLTPEDVRNPHDFPDLDDPDWQYEDGVLAGIQSVRVALRAMANRLEDENARPTGGGAEDRSERPR